MHLGRTYPFHHDFWQAEVFFWPGYVPRKIHVQLGVANGDFWDVLLPPTVTDVGIPDFGLVGDIAYGYADPGGVFDYFILFHKVAMFPKRYSISCRLENAFGVANIASLEVGPEVRTFGTFLPTLDSGAFPPVFNGNVPLLQMRAAKWSEV